MSLSWSSAFIMLAICAVCSSAAHADDDARTLDAKIAGAETRLKTLLERLTERHPDVIALRHVLDDLRAARAGVAEAPAAAPAALASPTALDPPVPPPVAAAREKRKFTYAKTIDELCGADGVIACFDFEGEHPLNSRVGAYHGALTRTAEGVTRAHVEHSQLTRNGAAVRMDFRPEDSADHGAFVVNADAFGEGDWLTVQWRQWFSPELVTTFDADHRPVLPAVGGDGAKQLSITEIGDEHGCSFGEVVTTNYYWSGVISLYHACGLWVTPRKEAPIGPRDPSDFDMQPGGDNVCRYRYFHNGLTQGVDYLYPTKPANLLEVPALAAVAHPRRYHGCFGWQAGQWMTFRVELKIAFCHAPWPDKTIPRECAKAGHVRYWVKYANEAKPWQIVNYRLPLRWRPEHSGRYGHFSFAPYNTHEKPLPNKPAAYTLYDDIVIARNAPALPWPRD